MKRIIAIAACVAAVSSNALWAAETVDVQKRAAELKSLRWGMFVCWSFSTFSGKEWTPGVKNIAAFRATDCDTDQWARTAKEAGMGYILFLTKHHDGFCLWDTKTTARKVTRAPLGATCWRNCGRAATSTASGWRCTSRSASSPTTRTIIPAATRRKCTRPSSRNFAPSTVRSSSSGWTAPKATAGWIAKKSRPGSSGFSRVVSSASTAAAPATCAPARWDGRARSRISS